MKSKIILFIVIFALLSWIAARNSDDSVSVDGRGLPQLRGYQWKKLPEVRAGFLMPKKWFFETAHDDKAWRYFISEHRRDFEASQGPALKLVVTTDKQRGKDARAWVLGFDKQLQAQGHDLKLSNLKQQAPMLSRSLLYKDASDKSKVRVVMRIVLGNAKTGKVYDLHYSAPQEQWVNVLNRGKKILGYFQLDPNF